MYILMEISTPHERGMTGLFQKKIGWSSGEGIAVGVEVRVGATVRVGAGSGVNEGFVVTVFVATGSPVKVRGIEVCEG